MIRERKGERRVHKEIPRLRENEREREGGGRQRERQGERDKETGREVEREKDREDIEIKTNEKKKITTSSFVNKIYFLFFIVDFNVDCLTVYLLMSLANYEMTT